MVQELQGLVDALAERLGRAILVEDSDQRVITYSAHADEGDEIRKEAILRRRSPAQAVSWAQRFGSPRREARSACRGTRAFVSPRGCVSRSDTGRRCSATCGSWTRTRR